MSEFDQNQPSAIQIYLDEIRQIPLLSPEEEIELCHIKDIGIQAQQQLIELEQTHEIPSDFVTQLIQQSEAGEQAISTMYNANLRLVVSIAKKYPNNQLQLLDRIQIGNDALMTAITRYDYRKGRISTFATKHIKGAIIREIYKQSDTVQIPIYLHGIIKKIKNSTVMLLTDISEDERETLLAEELGATTRTIRAAREAIELFHSKPFDELDEWIESDDVFSSSHPETLLERLEPYLAQLLPMERDVIELRYGLRDGTAYQFNEIHEILQSNTTIANIQRYEAQGRKRLKVLLQGSELEDYFDA